MYCRSIDTKKAYKPPDDARERIRKILETSVDNDALQPEWESTSLRDPKIKYTVNCLYEALLFVLFEVKCLLKFSNKTNNACYI